MKTIHLLSNTLFAFAAALSLHAESASQPAIAPHEAKPIPFSELGAKVSAEYSGDAIGITATRDGARLHTGFQKLSGTVTREGLRLDSTAEGGGGLRLVAGALGRGERCVELPATGAVAILEKGVSFTRPGLTEEYSVSVDGVRQDFVVTRNPVGAGALRVELALSGARAAATAFGAELVLEGSGRKLAYSKLVVTDANGRELSASMEVVSGERLAVRVEDAEAVYPVRIDPTFSDADWVALNAGVPGVNNTVSAAVADGAGNVYIGGSFTVVGNALISRVAKWDGTVWTALGTGTNGSVTALTVSGTDIYAGGTFTVAGGVTVNRVAKWDGSAWSSLGSGMDSSVAALRASGTDIYAGGTFTMAGGVPANRIAKWNGSAWSALGTGLDNTVSAVAVIGSNVFAGGTFLNAGGAGALRVARWNGTAWSALGTGMDNTVNAMAVMGADLFAGGTFTVAGGVANTSRIAKWNGSAWSALGTGANTSVLALAVSGTDLYAGGSFGLAGGVANTLRIAKWNGTAWSALGTGVNFGGNTVNALAVVGADVYAGGTFTTAGGSPATRIAKFNGTAWSTVGPAGLDGSVSAVATSGTDVYAGGTFITAGGVTVNRIAKWDGSAWFALGGGMDNTVSSLVVSGGDLYAGGSFTLVDGVGINRIAKWNGTAWSALGSGANGAVSALAVIGTDLYAGGAFLAASGAANTLRIAKWDGTAWSGLGTGVNNPVRALAVIGTDLYVGGVFTLAGGVANTIRVAKWDGSAWSALGTGMNNPVNALTVSGTDVYAGGSFTIADGSAAARIAKWNGTAWTNMGTGMNAAVNALAVSGVDIYAGGSFTTAGGVSANRIAKWNGSAWTNMGSGMSGTVNALAVGGPFVYAGGSFTTVGSSTISPYIVRADLAAPRIEVTQIANLIDGVSSVGLGAALLSTSSSPKTFTIANTGSANMTSLAITKDGANAADFTVSALSGTTILEGGGPVTFTVTFSPSALGARTAAIHIASNVFGAKNPFDIALTGTAVTTFGPTDGTMTLSPASPVVAYTTATATFAGWVTPEPPISYSLLVDNVLVSAQSASSSHSFTVPGIVGAHVLTGRAYDSLGNFTEISQTFTVDPAPQTINFPLISNRLTNDIPFELGATASSGLPVNYVVTVGDNVATVEDGTVTLTGVAGNVTIVATQAGGSGYSAAASVTRTFNVGLAAPDISVEQPAGTYLVDNTSSVDFGSVNTGGGSQVLTFTITNTGTALLNGLAVSTTGANASNFTVSALSTTSIPVGTFTSTFTVTFTPSSIGAKTAVIHVASNVSGAKNPFDIMLTGTGSLFAQAITFTNPGAHTFGDAPFALAATGGASGNPVTFSIVSGSATVSGNMLTITGAGSVAVRASQAGNASYSAAPDVDVTFSVAKATQTISFTNPGFRTFGDAPFGLVASGGGSGNAVTFSVISGPATVSGNTLSIIGAGSVTVRAVQAGNANYFAATDVEETFAVARAAQIISFTNPGAHVFGDAPFALVATGGGSGEAVTFSVVSGPASVSGDMLTLSGAGSVTVRASQAGNANYFAAVDADVTFNVAALGQTITFANPGTRTFGDAPFALMATGGASGNPVTFSIVNGPATLAGDTITLTGGGSVTVRASQAGNANYGAAPDVDRTFMVSSATQVITFGALGNKVFGDAAFTVSATGGASGEPVTFTASGAATVSGNLVTITGVGSVTITANQAGNANYTAATPVDQSFNVTQGTQTITFTLPPRASTTDTVTLSATGGASGNAVTFALVSGPGSVAGNSLTFSAVGTVVVRASQLGNANYLAATNVNASIDAVINSQPTAVDDAVISTTGTTVIYPLANDVDPNGDELTITAVSDAAVTIEGRTLILPVGYASTFNYTLSDGLATDTADVVVTAGTPQAARSRWTGLLVDNNGAIVGRMNATRTATGNFISVVKLGTETKVVKFRLVPDPDGTVTVATPLGDITATEDAVTGRLAISLDATIGTVTGSLRRSALAGTAQKLNIALASIDTAIPGGGVMKVSQFASGRLVFNMTLPDGKTVSGNTDLADNGTCVIYNRVARTNPAAFIAGEINLANLINTDATGEFAWMKPAQVLPGPHQSVVNTVLTANGCIFTPGAALPSGAVTLHLSGGNLAANLTIPTIATNGIPANTTPSIAFWMVKPLTGTFTTKVYRAPSLRVGGSGVYLPKSNSAWGYFPGTTLGGRIELR